MKIVTAISFFTTNEGTRIAIRYSVIDPNTGEILEANKRIDRIVVNPSALEHCEAIKQFAQSLLDEVE